MRPRRPIASWRVATPSSASGSMCSRAARGALRTMVPYMRMLRGMLRARARPGKRNRDGTRMTARNDYEDIPGTTVFDARRSRQGYHLNMFFMSLIKPENRAAFKADEAGYIARYPMSPEQRDAVLARDWN